MDDGGMGSLAFVSRKGKKYGGILAEAEFHDADGTLVSAALFLDQEGELYELDIWKVDFSPLIRIPSVDKMKIATVITASERR